MSDYAVQILCGLGLEPGAARAVAPSLRVASYEAGEPVWLQNQRVSHWCFLMTGIVVGASPRMGGKRLPMSLHGPQSWFGDIAIFNDEPTVLDYMCATDVQLIRMPVQALRQAVATDAGFCAHLLGLAARRAQLQMDLVISLKLGSPTMRTMLGLAQIADALWASARGAGVLEVPIKQSLIAAICGVSRTLLSNYLQSLQLAGWVRVHYSRLELVEPQAWVRLAHTMHRHRLFDRNVTVEDMVRELDAAAAQGAAACPH